MKLDKNTRNFYFLLALGIIIPALALFFVYQTFVGGGAQKALDDQYAVFPAGNNNGDIQTDLSVEGVENYFNEIPEAYQDFSDEEPFKQSTSNQEEDWRDEIVQISQTDSTYQSKNTSNSSKAPVTVAEANYLARLDVGNAETRLSKRTVEELLAAQAELSDYAKNYPTTTPPPGSIVADLISMVESSRQYTIFKVSDLKPANCGTVNVPTSDSALKKMMADLGENYSAICMGKAIANKCAASKTTIKTGTSEQTLYVVEKEDQECSVGIVASGGDFINLCSVKDVMNAIEDKNMSFLSWQAVFANNPGDTFAALYLGNFTEVLDAMNKGNVNCESVSL